MPPNLGSVVSQCCTRVGGRSFGRPQARGFCSLPGSNGEEKAVATGLKSFCLNAKNIRVFRIWMTTGYAINFVWEMHGLIKVKQRVDAEWKDLRRRLRERESRNARERGSDENDIVYCVDHDDHVIPTQQAHSNNL